MHVHARACIFQENDLRSAHLQTLDYHPAKFHVKTPVVSENIRGQKTGRKKKKKKKKKKKNKKQSKTNMFPDFVWGT